MKRNEHLRNRYQCETVNAEDALAAWLEFRAGATRTPNVKVSGLPQPKGD